jgi:tRNA pseudouridine38-40 synthase
MPRYKLTLEYDGTGLSGWQRQQDVPSVQQYVEEAIAAYCGREVTIQCAGRTDAGVHALGQVAHVDLPEAREEYSVQQGINYHLKTPQVAVLKAQRVADDFNARFDATRRYYHYRIICRNAPLTVERHRAWQVFEPLDAAAMHDAAQILVGHHDFTSFRDSQCQAKSPVKTLDEITVSEHAGVINVRLHALSFLHHQVRIMVGNLRLIGNGKWKKQDLQKALDAKDRKAAGPTAPACGLYLVGVKYP